MSALTAGDKAVGLPWLVPGGAALVALTGEPGPSLWERIRTDPACVLLLYRSDTTAGPWPQPADIPCPVPRLPLHERPGPGFFNTARRLLGDLPNHFLSWDDPNARPIFETAWRCARLACRIAGLTHGCDPERAWVAGLLAPLGWFAVAAVDAAAASDCRLDPKLPEHPETVQEQHWGLSAAAIARRLARRFGLPTWLAAVVGHLDLPAEVAAGFGGDPQVIRVVQLAAILVQGATRQLGLAAALDAAELTAALGLTRHGVDALEEWSAAPTDDLPREPWNNPSTMPLLPDLLRLAAENGRARGTSEVTRLEREVDRLQQSLREQARSESRRRLESKLAAIAELAAGAGHEINNPLAVISGQGQYLLAREEDPGRQKALQTIIGQTRRIHDLLTELMQFARPARPQPEAVELNGLVAAVLAGLRELAEQRQVNLEWSPPPGPTTLLADPKQLQTALTAIVRNGIEAAPAGGWVRLRAEGNPAGPVMLAIEDSGPGPTPAQREHLFDPFYSGRQAGRGRGLGLPIAWRLVRLQGGDVVFAAPPQGPTRFLLRVPRAAVERPDRLSA